MLNRTQCCYHRKVNKRIDEQIEQNIRHYSGRTNEEIYRRIHNLGQEWDIDRVLETMTSFLLLTGIVLDSIVDRRCTSFQRLCFHSYFCMPFRGWYPPLPMFRALAIRTRKEIAREVMRLMLWRVTLQESQKSQGGLNRL
jgi:hypothetical protein